MSLIEDLDKEGYDTTRITPELISSLEKEGFDTSGLQRPAKQPKLGVIDSAMNMAAQSGGPLAALGVAGMKGYGKIQEGFDKAGEVAAESLASGTSLKNTGLPVPMNVLPANTPGKGLQLPPEAAAGVGTAIQMTPDIATSFIGMKNPLSGVKATGPFTAGLAQPSTAIPGSLKASQKALGEAKIAARAGEDVGEAARLRSMSATPGGVRKLAEEAIKLTEKGATSIKDVANTQLLAYRQALGEMQSKGGTFSNDYKVAFDKLSKMLKAKSPELAAKLKDTAINYLAKEGPEFRAPVLTTAVNPMVGAARAAYSAMQMAPVRNAAGAATNMGIRTAPAASNALMEAFNRLTKKKK